MRFRAAHGLVLASLVLGGPAMGKDETPSAWLPAVGSHNVVLVLEGVGQADVRGERVARAEPQVFCVRGRSTFYDARPKVERDKQSYQLVCVREADIRVSTAKLDGDLRASEWVVTAVITARGDD